MVNPRARKKSPVRRPKAAPISRKFRAWLSLEPGEVYQVTACRFCGMDPAKAALEEIPKLADCMNCWADLHCKGGWTGQSRAYLRALWAKKENRSSPAWLVVEKVWKGERR